MVKKKQKIQANGQSIVMGVLIGIFLTLLFQVLFVQSDINKEKEAITTKFLNQSSLECGDPTDPISPTDRVAVFKKYLKINSRLNRAVIRGCNDIDSMLAKNPKGEWEATTVNVSLDTRANPKWQKACLIEDITTTDDTIRPENAGIDESNLQACTALAELNLPD